MSRCWCRVEFTLDAGQWGELGIKDPEAEFTRWLEEREAILKMNRELTGRPARGGARERGEPPVEVGEE